MTDMDRRAFLKRSMAAAAFAALPAVAAAASPATRRSKPNILVFLTDDHGQWAQHAYGSKELVTPNLDGLAARGVRMANAFTTTPVCSPARATFWTGVMPSQHGIHDWIDETGAGKDHPGLNGQTILPELLKAAGYHTGVVGKWHCGQDRVPKPGVDHWFSYWLNQYPHRGTQNFSDQGRHVVEQGSQSPLLTSHALAFLRDHRRSPATRDEPFFLFVGYVDTHSPHTDAPEDLVAQYAGATFADIPRETLPAAHGTVRSPKAKTVEAERARLRQYYGAASSVDREVGRVLDDLRANGELDDTFVVYTGDHGLNCGHHGIWEKGNGTMPQNFLEESIRVACTLSWPGGNLTAGAACPLLVSHPDLWATLLDVAGANAPATVRSPGLSYLPALRGGPAGDRDAVFAEYGNARMVRTATHKLIVRRPFAGVTFPHELYDLLADPRETTNRHADPAVAAVVRDLTARLDAFFHTYSTPAHDGSRLAELPVCNGDEPWRVAARLHDQSPAAPPRGPPHRGTRARAAGL
jgi:choline-sulfatase